MSNVVPCGAGDQQIAKWMHKGNSRQLANRSTAKLLIQRLPPSDDLLTASAT